MQIAHGAAVGIICEYNPFHTGHAHHIQEAKRLSGANLCVGAMSGSFVQRAEAAVADKWLRARMALEGGMDLVIEIPALFAVRAARDFASAGVRLLHALGCTHIAFGCEEEDGELLRALARALCAEPPALSKAVREGLAAGKSYPRALSEGVLAWNGLPFAAEQLAAALNGPNNALAIEYLIALQRQGAPLIPVFVRRTAPHHAQEAAAYASASAVRRMLLAGNDAAERYVPFAYGELADGLARPDALNVLLLDALRTRADGLIGLPDWERGLHLRLQHAAQEAVGFPEALALAKSKRVTMARLRRLCAQLLLGVTPELIAQHPRPEYARVLGMKSTAHALLRQARGGDLPVVYSAARLRGNPAFALDARATDLQALCLGRPAGADYTRPPYMPAEGADDSYRNE